MKTSSFISVLACISFLSLAFACGKQEDKSEAKSQFSDANGVDIKQKDAYPKDTVQDQYSKTDYEKNEDGSLKWTDGDKSYEICNGTSDTVVKDDAGRQWGANKVNGQSVSCKYVDLPAE